MAGDEYTLQWTRETNVPLERWSARLIAPYRSDAIAQVSWAELPGRWLLSCRTGRAWTVPLVGACTPPRKKPCITWTGGSTITGGPCLGSSPSTLAACRSGRWLADPGGAHTGFVAG